MYFIVWPWSFWRTVNVFLSSREISSEKIHKVGSYLMKYKLLLILHFKCSLSFVSLDYVLFQQCTLIFYFFIKITFVLSIHLKNNNNENKKWKKKNIKTHKKPKLYPILFLRKYDFQNIEYVILKWISIKKLEFLLMLLIRRRRWWQSFIRYMKVMESAYLLQIGFALLLTLLYCLIK